ncbi:hypothetical protein PN487_16570, partial [Microcystis aeruginosa CS-556/03]|nr:hypothetical protein [Microcystis aeruginosa CS-556/03]
VAGVAHACAGLGEIYSITRKDDLAYQYLNQALDIALDIGERYIELETLIVLAEFGEKPMILNQLLITGNELYIFLKN